MQHQDLYTLSLVYLRAPHVAEERQDDVFFFLFAKDGQTDQKSKADGVHHVYIAYMKARTFNCECQSRQQATHVRLELESGSQENQGNLGKHDDDVVRLGIFKNMDRAQNGEIQWK